MFGLLFYFKEKYTNTVELDHYEVSDLGQHSCVNVPFMGRKAQLG